MIDATAARDLILEQNFNWGTETISLGRATGRTLRQSVTADRDQPPFDRVAMDGISINFQVYATGKRCFSRSHFAPAGTAQMALKAPEMCVEVMTGAPLPPGTTTVIRYEDLVVEGELFTVPDGIVDGQSIHRRASDAGAGDLILKPGVRIGAAEMAALATYGIADVEVARMPKVAIASTGDEVVPVDQVPLDHQIRSSNVHQLAALFREIGIVPTLGHLPDDSASGQQALKRLIDTHDILLLSGGVSKGKLDHVPEWLAAAGIECLFHRVAQRPGKPLWVGRNSETMVFALPGNPVSSLVGAVAYVGPFLRHQLGNTRPDMRVVLSEEVDFGPDLTLFQQCRLNNIEGRLMASPMRGSGSGDLVSLLSADGFLVLPRGSQRYTRGGVFDFIPPSLR